MRVMKIKETKLVCTVAANVPKSLSDVSILQLWMQDLENGIVSERWLKLVMNLEHYQQVQEMQYRGQVHTLVLSLQPSVSRCLHGLGCPIWKFWWKGSNGYLATILMSLCSPSFFSSQVNIEVVYRSYMDEEAQLESIVVPTKVAENEQEYRVLNPRYGRTNTLYFIILVLN